MIKDIKIIKAHVLDEVAKTTAYVGAKTVEDAGAYQRVFTTDADREMLERFWLETCSAATDSLRPWLNYVGPQPASKEDLLQSNYEAKLEMPENWDSNLLDAVQGSLFTFFANNICSKWFAVAKKDEAEYYATVAQSMLEDAELKLFHRKRPTRPVYNDANANENI